MNKLTQIIALVLALMLPLSAAAFAEDDSTVYTIAVMNPVLTRDGETLLDLTGLDVEFSAAVTDLGVLGLLMGCYAGDQLDLVTSAQLQFDANGMAAYLDGMSSVYGLSASSIAELTGDPATLDAILVPMRTLLMDAAAQAEAFEIPEDWRFQAVHAVFSGLEISSQTQGEVVHSFNFDCERADAALRDYAGLVDEANPGMKPGAVEQLEALGLTFEASGTVTATAGDGETGIGSVAIDAKGNLISTADQTSVPYTVDYSDDGQNVVCRAVIGSAGEEVTLDFELSPVAGSRQINASFRMDAPSKNLTLLSEAALNTNGDDTGFDFSISGSNDVTALSMSVSYTGAMVEDDKGNYHLGQLSLASVADNEKYEFSSTIVAMQQEASTAAWMLDTASLTDVTTLDEQALSAAYMDALDQASAALSRLQELVPGMNTASNAETISEAMPSDGSN